VQLAKEILFDMKQAEQAAKQQQQQQQQAGAACRGAGPPGTPYQPPLPSQQGQNPASAGAGQQNGDSANVPTSASHTPARPAAAGAGGQATAGSQEAGQQLQGHTTARTPGAALLAARR